MFPAAAARRLYRLPLFLLLVEWHVLLHTCSATQQRRLLQEPPPPPYSSEADVSNEADFLAALGTPSVEVRQTDTRHVACGCRIATCLGQFVSVTGFVDLQVWVDTV